MKRIFLPFIIALLSVVTACAQTTVIDSFQSDGVWRSYRLYVPANYNATAQHPLILNMHGLGSNSFEQQYYSNFMPIADTAQFLMAYPQGLSVNGTAYWNVGIPLTPQTNDVKFLSALIDTLSKRYVVDAQRVFATGMSMGGYMSHYLALKLNNKIAAIASVTGTMDPSVYATASPGRAVPMMQIHGTADPTVPYTGNSTGINIDTLVAFWVRNNQCSPTPIYSTVPDVNTMDGCTAEHYVWTGGRHGSTCEFYKIIGGGHTWPGAPVAIGVTNQDFNASAEIWRFFRGYKLNQFLAVNNVIKEDALVVWPNPCKNILNVVTEAAVTISDIGGKVLLNTCGPQVNVSGLPAGNYIIKKAGVKGSAIITKE